ncbi:Zinc metalloproteinase [Aphelenchoides besseyi]|nr:Zinc metalloproteinase [Aphelenchoides besseyi]
MAGRRATVLGSLVVLLILTIADADYFLREPQWSNREDVNSRSRRETLEWQTKLREKARSFGQTIEEQEQVQKYVNRLNDIALSQHNSEPPRSHEQDGNLDEAEKQFMSWSRQRMRDDATTTPEEKGHHFEGDIVLTPDQAEALLENAIDVGSRRVKRKFIGSRVRRWDPKKPILYSFDGSHTQREQRVIELALEHWHNITCLNFERRNDEPTGNRIVFTDVDGCASNVGKHPLGEPQFVSLAPECIRLGVIAHEVAHALGFWHEQSRPDRDYFVYNIDRDSKGQFLKEQPVDVDNGGVPYDYGSIMHYRSKAFSRYDDLFTLNTFISDYQRTIGQRDQLSFNDIRLMNTIYCRDTCPKSLPCQRGGYTDPRRCDRCRCPDGFTSTRIKLPSLPISMYSIRKYPNKHLSVYIYAKLPGSLDDFTGQFDLCDQVMPGYGANCGGRVQVTSKWLKFSSPGYPNEFREGQECSWLFVAPKGQHVQLQFIGEFEMYCKVRHSLCMDYIEIRNSTDFANTGMRYCCYGTPQSSIVSATEDMLVLFRSFYRGGKGFQAQVRAIPNTGTYSEWSGWSSCTASCGACGVRRRSRRCTPSTSFCLGDDTETEVCNRKPCSGLCSRKYVTESPCNGFLSLLKGVRCKTEKTHMQECDEICCPNFTLIDGECHLAYDKTFLSI